MTTDRLSAEAIVLLGERRALMDSDGVFGLIFVILCIVVIVVGIIDYTLLIKAIFLLGLLGPWLLPLALGVGIVFAIIIAVLKS